jgi:hypothetical protein
VVARTDVALVHTMEGEKLDRRQTGIMAAEPEFHDQVDWAVVK